MVFHEGPIEGLVVRPLTRHEDARGWLIELFRCDELPPELAPVMAYVSQTLPGATRGPHEHRDQTDLFACFGPGDLELTAWDARAASPTRGNRTTLRIGRSNPMLVAIPPGVVHGYRNTSEEPALVVNAPNRLYAGRGRSEQVDEIRHEERADSPFRLD